MEAYYRQTRSTRGLSATAELLVFHKLDVGNPANELPAAAVSIAGREFPGILKASSLSKNFVQNFDRASFSLCGVFIQCTVV